MNGEEWNHTESCGWPFLCWGPLSPGIFSKTTLKSTHFHILRVTGSDTSYQVEGTVPSLQTWVVTDVPLYLQGHTVINTLLLDFI